MRVIYSIMGNQQRLDGGAMFGNAPKSMWTKWIDVDDQNRIPLCCRAMLVQESGRNILFETGIGAFFEPKFKERYGVIESEHVLLQSLEAIGLKDTDIDVVVLSHLHFDHAGGLLTTWVEGLESRLLFQNAVYMVSEQAWNRAINPHPRDKASFIPKLNSLLERSDRLELVSGTQSKTLGAGYSFHYSEGHTPGLMLTEINMPSGPIIFAADLIPGVPWVHVPLTMGYDRFAEQLINEKKALLEYLLSCGGRIFYTHDVKVALSEIEKDEKGRFVSKNALRVVSELSS